MGDRCYVRMTFGGNIDHDTLEKLVDTLERQGFIYDACTMDVMERLATLGLDGVEQDEVNYANTDAIDEICREHGVDFDKSHDAGGSYDAATIRMRGGGLTEYPTDGDGEPMVPLADIIAADALATGWADLMTKAREWRDGKLQPLVLV